MEHQTGAAVLNSHSTAEPRLQWVMCASKGGAHRMAYWEWGDPSNDQVLLCLHGLTRTGRDFDSLARRLAPYYRVVAPDVAGRGRSDWLADPGSYTVIQYVADMLVLLARLQPRQLHWVGTSMGGLIALGMRAILLNSERTRPINGSGLPPQAAFSFGKLVLNDVGPSLSLGGVQRIAQVLVQEQEFDTYQQALAYVQSSSEHLGLLDAESWDALTRYQYVEHDGRWRRHFDNRLTQSFTQQAQSDLAQAQALLWEGYERWPAPILILRGGRSDVLSAPQVQQMLGRHPDAQAHELPGIGHAPSLLRETELALVEQFLLERS